MDGGLSRESSYREESVDRHSISSVNDHYNSYGPSVSSAYDSQSSLSHSGDGMSTETGKSSVPSKDSIHASSIYETYTQFHATPNNNLLPPSRDPSRPASSLGHENNDGRRTPTASNWALELEPPSMAHLEIGSRKRTASDATINAVDANLPSTPAPDSAPHRVLQHQRSFLDTADSARNRPESVNFPVPRPSYFDAPSSGSSSLREDINNIPSPLNRGSPMPRPQPDMFPDSRERVPQRRQSQTSSIHPSIASSERPRSAALSASWNQQQQQPSSWVQTKLQIHQSHVEDEYYDDDEEGYRRPSTYEEDILDEYDDDEDPEAEEVNEIRFFQPAFLSEAALQLRDRVERRRQMKAGIAWVGSFTGRDIVVSESYLGRILSC